MEEQINTRIPDRLAEELSRANLSNRSDIIRSALMDALVSETVGVCAITGQRCYRGESTTVAMDSPIGEYLPISDLPSVRLDGDRFDSLAKMQAKGELQPLEADELYATEVGMATYYAENQYLDAALPNEGFHDQAWASQHSWARLWLSTEMEKSLSERLRVVSALEWCYVNDTPESVTIQTIWEEQDTDIQDKIIGRGDENSNTILAEGLDELDVDYDRAVI